MLFESEWQKEAKPFQTDSTYKCHYLQGKWELSGQYALKFPHYTKYIVSIPKSVDFHGWCRHGRINGDTLEGIEFLTNSIYLLEKDLDPEAPGSKEQMTIIGEISGLFLDEIIFDSQGEITREGRRIGRYRYVQNKQSGKSTEESASILSTAAEHLSKISHPNCPTKIYDIDHKTIQLDISDSKSIIENRTVMEFKCKYKEPPEQEYYKKLILKKSPY